MAIIEDYNQMAKKYIFLIIILLSVVVYFCRTEKYITEYYPSGKKFEYGKVIGEKKEGKWIRWYESGEKQGEYLYHKNQLNGLSIQWFRDGKIQALAKYKNNKFVDTLKFFFKNGKPNYIKYFTAGGLQYGNFTVWHENGNVSQSGYYVKGEEDGEWRTYYEDGKLETISYFKSGKEIGDWITYSKDGQVLEKVSH